LALDLPARGLEKGELDEPGPRARDEVEPPPAGDSAAPPEDDPPPRGGVCGAAGTVDRLVVAVVDEAEVGAVVGKLVDVGSGSGTVVVGSGSGTVVVGNVVVGNVAVGNGSVAEGTVGS
jgi:hypothetical protein